MLFQGTTLQLCIYICSILLNSKQSTVKLLSHSTTFWSYFKPTFYLRQFFGRNSLNFECDRDQPTVHKQLLVQLLFPAFCNTIPQDG